VTWSWSTFAALAACVALISSDAAAQRQQPSPEQRLERLEKQLIQLQRHVFPKGRPADTAGFSDNPAATQSSVAALAQRLDSIERQITDLIRMTEENGNRLRTIESDAERIRSEQDRKLADLEQRIAAALAAPTVSEPPAAAPEPAAVAAKPKTAAPSTAQPAAEDPGEAAYTEGFKLWESGRYDEAIESLRAFVSAHPKHRRVSFANNLIGRALLDKGDAKAAVPAFIANYRGNPAGERAPDSLYYLGQALLALGQPAQACNAFAELDDIYGSKIRPELKTLQTEAKQKAQCRNQANE
jgi:TolA-binding protein